jgi:hypothetical protein
MKPRGSSRSVHGTMPSDSSCRALELTKGQDELTGASREGTRRRWARARSIVPRCTRRVVPCCARHRHRCRSPTRLGHHHSSFGARDKQCPIVAFCAGRHNDLRMSLLEPREVAHALGVCVVLVVIAQEDSWHAVVPSEVVKPGTRSSAPRRDRRSPPLPVPALHFNHWCGRAQALGPMQLAVANRREMRGLFAQPAESGSLRNRRRRRAKAVRSALCVSCPASGSAGVAEEARQPRRGGRARAVRRERLGSRAQVPRHGGRALLVATGWLGRGGVSESVERRFPLARRPRPAASATPPATPRVPGPRIVLSSGGRDLYRHLNSAKE